MSEQPFVSVVTPFFNTAEYLAECIQSVLSQTYENFEYILVDNQSTDGSSEIAAFFACQDNRIKLVRNRRFLDQVPNYNNALRRVNREARYVKMVLADDFIFPECLERMVAVAEAHPSVAIVSSYYLEGRFVCGSGVEWPTEVIPGRVAGRLHLLDNLYLFGTPTNLLYRADLLANRRPFFSESSMHEDTELCHEVLAEADLGFVHQVLTFSRRGNEGVLTAIESFHWRRPFIYTILRKYGAAFLTEEELPRRLRPARADFLRILAEGVLLKREPEFWDYHRRALATIGEDLPSRLQLAPHIARATVKAMVKPKWIINERSRIARMRQRTVSA
ncbi:MAG: glycosyltransferase family 2 protein [Gemmatimonadaceae bacterium]